MSATALIWLVVFVAFLIASVSRPVYGCTAYMMTFFAAPPFWWWGKGMLTSLTLRWSLVGAAALIAVVLFHWGRKPTLNRSERIFFTLLGIFVINAFLVHDLAAANPISSANYLDVLWKSAGLSLLIRYCITTESDLQTFLFSIVSLCGYIGYEVVIDDAGQMSQGRLEGIGVPGASGANGIAALVSMGLVLAGYFVISCPSLPMRISAFLMSPLILDVVLRCNSRGAFLGLIASGVWMITSARGPIRKRVLLLLGLGCTAVLLQAGDENIWLRFFSTFESGENRDNAANERLLYWEAAIKMIADYPLGKGGKAAFASELGSRYIAHFRPNEFRSVHNGFLDLMAGWGIQGFILFMTAIMITMVCAYRKTWLYAGSGHYSMSLLGATLQATMVGQFICTVFTSVLDGEWYLWLAVINLSYSALPLPTSRVDSSINLDK